MRRITIITALFLCVFISFCPAETSIKAEIDKTVIATDDILTYKVTVVSSQGHLPKPQIPLLQDFQLISQVESSSLSLNQSERKIILAYTFILAPLQKGRFKIPPAQISIGGKTYASEAIEIEVRPSETLPEAENPPTQPLEYPQDSKQPRVTL